MGGLRPWMGRPARAGFLTEIRQLLDVVQIKS
jgi:hypothetical protein